MCDTVVLTAEATADGVTLLGKNSDREPNEAHLLLRMPAATHAPGSRLRCTYVELPQVAETFAVLLAKPFWMWGAEMGVNEHGVAIGNEAVFTKVPYEKGDGLLGMDLLRLGLERGRTAQQALQVITDLLAEFGQGGNSGFQHAVYYHNSFIIADPRDAWVLETAGRHWAARQVRGVYTISNGITIGANWDLASPDLVSYAVSRGWCRGRDDFHFGRCYSDFLYTRFSDCHHRCRRTTDLLTQQAGRITVDTVIAVLRDHRAGGELERNPDRGFTGASVCMHAGFGPVRSSQTTGSLVSYLHPEQPVHFVTGTAAPCTGLFKPVWVDTELPDMGPEPRGFYDKASLFWQHEALHRETLRDYTARLASYQTERDELERTFVSRGLAAATRDRQERARVSAACFDESISAESAWLQQVAARPVKRRPGRLYRYAWNRFNAQAGMPAGVPARTPRPAPSA